MRILLICYDFSANKSATTLRWRALAQQMRVENAEVFIHSARGRTSAKSFKLEDEPYDEAEGRPAGTSFLSRKDGGGAFSPISLLRRIVFFVYDCSWKRIYWPDFAVVWSVVSIVHCWRSIRCYGIDHCIVVSRPFSSTLVPIILNATGTRISWSIEYLDPFANSEPPVNNDKLYSALNRWFERIALKRSSNIFVLNSAMKERLADCHQDIASRVTVVPNLFSPFTSVASVSRAYKLADIWDVAYVGSLNAQFRSPENALRLFELVIKQQPRVRLNFYGEHSYCDEIFSRYKHLIGASVFLHGAVDPTMASGVVRSSRVLLSIGNSNSYQEPSKITEYLAAGRPILHVASVSDDAVSNLLNGLSHCLCVEPLGGVTANENSARAVAEFIKQPPEVTFESCFDILRLRQPKVIANQILDAVRGGC